MPSSPPPPQTALQVAAGLIAAGRAQEAARELNALVRAAPTYAAAYVLLAKAREASGDHVRALDAWHRAHFLVPSSPLVRRERQRLLDKLAPPPPPSELLAPAQEAYEVPEMPPLESIEEPDPFVPEPEDDTNHVEAGLLPPLTENVPAEPEASTEPPAVEEDWQVVYEHDVPAPPPPSAPLPTEVLSPEADEPEDEPDHLPSDLGPVFSEAIELPDETGLDNDLDALIRDLEHAPRIKPDPEFDGPDVVSGDPEVEEIASETLAQIYAAQKQYAEAAVVYERLARQKPDRADEMQRRAREMRDKAL